MMSGNDSSATATLTPTSVAVVSTVISTAEEEEEDPAALTLDCVESADMDLVNGPNPWLPAYGFQLQHHSQFQPTHLEDLRANDTVLVQQVDFLETILEETSDDLQSDSDRSGTTYWLGSDSETESVIHIKTKQRSADERLDGSGSECNSVVPKKRRRRDHGTDHHHHHHHHHHHQQVTAYDEYPASPRSSRSTASSRSSSLLQFESLERTCATLSPSSYSFDSLEYSNRSNTSHPENDSPDSLEQDYDGLLPNGFASTLADHFPRIRPYRSFESLDTCQKDEGFGQASMPNGFAPLYLKRGADLSNIRKNNQRPRDFWHEDEEYEDDDNDEEADDEYDFEKYEPNRTNADSQLTTGFEDRLLLYGESGKYATSLDYRNTIDLREIGVETKRDALLELKSGQKTARLNIAGSGAEHHHHHHHHHHHQHPQQQQQYQQQQYDQHDHHHHHHRRRRQQQHQGWSDEEHFNFRFTDKSQSAPSLLDGVEESARSGLSCISPSRPRTSRTTSYVSTSSLFENYTRVASVPVDLNLCGVAATCDDDMNGREMAELAPDDEAATLKNPQDDAILKKNDETQAETKVALTSSVRTQPAQGALMDGNMEDHEKENEERTTVERASDHSEMPQTRSNKQTKSTVKTQDRSNCVLDMAMMTENDLDEAIKQFKREVEEAAASGVTNAAILAMETIQRTPSGRLRSRKVKNNASYELAQHLEVDERNFQRKLKDNDESRDGASSPGKRWMLNNASYELAQQCDYIKTLQSSRAEFQRMDACDELEESASGRSSGLKVADVMRQMGSDTNISEDSRPMEPQNDSFFGQIKKNSDPFSACGDASALNPRLLDDEVDYPCLETKPIGASCLENRVILREKIESEKPTQLKSVLENSAAKSSHVNEESSSKRNEEETGDVKKSFIGEFYPEQAAQLTQQCLQAGESNSQEGKMNSENAPSNRDQDRSRSPGSGDRGAGERLWRVVIEKQATAMKEEVEEEEKSDGAEAVEKKGVEEEGHSVRGVGSESPPDGPGSLGERSSGKPAVAVVAVDTNHRGGDRDKRQGDEQQRAPSINKQDASVAKRSSVVAPKREPAKTYAASSISLPTSSSSVAMKSEERKKGGLGGFLQRFSRLRFSGRTKVPRSETHKKPVEPTARTQEEQQPSNAKKKEPDYIIIPLHPPEEERRRQQEVVTLEEAARRNNVDIQRSASSVSNGRAPVSSKPPLPPQPPRVAALGTTTRASASTSASRRRAATDLGNPAAIEMAKARAMQAAQERPVGLLETDLDEAVINTSYNGTAYTAGPIAVSAAAAATAAGAAAAAAGAGGKKTRSLLDLNHTSAAAPRPRPEHALHVPQSPVGATHRSPRDDVASAATSAIHQRPHKSMEFLLDKENLHFVKPPENELQKVGERVPSEHELRVQRSLQRLNVPDWYKNSPAARDGFRLKRHSDASQHGGWRALGSKTTSLSSLSSSSNRQPTTGVLLSPSPTPPVFSRWSTSLLNSAGSSPASSARSSFNHRQPYLGWRSQERLANPRTPAERLAQGILPQLQAANKQQQQQQQTTNQQLEVRNSIKEVTSAIVHYVQSGQEVSGGGGGGGRLSPRPRPEDWDDRGGARSTSPRGSVKLCWMESSFVGTRPVDSPETPMSLATDQEGGDCCNAAGTESCSCQDSAASGLYLDLTPTRDDVHQHHQTSSAGLSPTSSNYHHHHRQRHQHRQQQQQRHHRGELLLA